jgi:tRNA dimethylallyltransferase
MSRLRALLVSGPSASGKSALALELALKLNGEIISADSVQVYRGLDIGSAKPERALRERIKHHLIDIKEPNEEFNAGDFVRLADSAVADITTRGRIPILCGGTTMYLSALLSGLAELPQGDTALRSAWALVPTEKLYQELKKIEPLTTLHPNDRTRIVRALEVHSISGKTLTQLQPGNVISTSPTVLAIVLCPPRDLLYKMIEARSNAMLDAGLVEEAQGLAAMYGANARSIQSIGYKQVLESTNLISTEIATKITVATRRYAKRQMTFWRNEPKKRGWVIKPAANEQGVFVGAEAGTASQRAKRLGFFAYSYTAEELTEAVTRWWQSAPAVSEVWYVATPLTT